MATVSVRYIVNDVDEAIAFYCDQLGMKLLRKHDFPGGEFTLAFVGSVISETVASNRGIGNMMMIASASFDVPLVYAGLFILAVLGVALYAIFSLVEGRVTGWAHRKTEFAMGA